MRRLFLFLTVVFLFILGAGLSTLPEVFRRGYAIPSTGDWLPATPPELFMLALFNIFLFFGVLLAIALHHGLRVMIALFVIFRVAEIFWEYTLNRHSLWYLLFTMTVYLFFGVASIYLVTRAERMKKRLA